MKNEKLMINVIMVNGKYNAVIAGLTRLSNLFAWLAKNPLNNGILTFVRMTNKKIPLLWRGVRRTGWLFTLPLVS
jgi:hypothetical protein